MSPWFQLSALSLATFILTKLIVDLDFPPVLWIRDRVIGGWRRPTLAEQHHPSYPTGELAEHAIRAVHDLGTFCLIDGEIHIWRSRSRRVPLFFSELMSCPWCVSGWVSLAVVSGTWGLLSLPVPVLMWPAVWALGALLAQHEWD